MQVNSSPTVKLQRLQQAEISKTSTTHPTTSQKIDVLVNTSSIGRMSDGLGEGPMVMTEGEFKSWKQRRSEMQQRILAGLSISS